MWFVRVAAGIRDALRLTILALFMYLLYFNMSRYLSEHILTRVRRYSVPLPNITVCPSNLETFTVLQDPMMSWLWASGKESSRTLIGRHNTRVKQNMTLCIGGAGVQPRTCAPGAVGIGHWQSSITPPGFVCHTLITSKGMRDSRKIEITLDGAQLWPDGRSLMILHTGEKPPLQPGQYDNSMATLPMQAGYGLTAALTFREFRRTNAKRLPCIKHHSYTKDQCVLDCRWRHAAEQEGCRGSWQTTVNMPVCSSQQDIDNLHHSFLSTSVHQCASCYNPCLHRDYFIVDRVNRTDMPAHSHNASLMLQTANHQLQVQEFLGYTGEDLMSDIGSNIGLLLGLSAFTIISLVERSLRTLLERFQQSVSAQAVASEAVNQLSQLARRRASSLYSTSSAKMAVSPMGATHDQLPQ